DKIAWYKNLGGGVFGSQQIIIIGTANVYDPTSVFAIDLDNDGNIDVLSASNLDNKIAWYKNLGGGVFGSQQIISTNANNPQSLFSIDLDNDGNNDVLSASEDDNKIAWYKNLGGGVFGSQQIITTNVISPNFVFAIDLDNDGNTDVLSVSNGNGDNKIA